MKKIFKSRKKTIINKIKIIKLLLISFFSAFIINNFIPINNKDIINLFTNTSLNKIIKYNIKLKSNYILNVGLGNIEEINLSKVVNKHNINIKNDLKNKIYIYNTHQTEEYKIIDNYNITPTVYTASYVLKDKLKGYNIGSIVEDKDLKEELNKYGYNYNNAYKVSRKWLESLNNNTLDLYIDLHRDSISYDKSNIMIENKDYAKIMFVVGTDYDYQNNYDVVDKINKQIINIKPDISRGIFTRKSIYNQDFNKNCILIEIGGPESSLESVINSIDVLSLAISKYLGE